MIYLKLKGRIGNQLFMYAAARCISKKRNKNECIVIDDRDVQNLGWKNSLKDYNLNNVIYTNDDKILKRLNFYFKQLFFNFIFYLFSKLFTYRFRYKIENKFKYFFSKIGMIYCENGYFDLIVPKNENMYMQGYFQCEKFFEEVSNEITKTFSLKEELKSINYPEINLLYNRNSVCISIKIEHNVGSKIYDVCNNGYWEKAIKYITDNVENPLFFICSDNVDYVLKNLIDTTKFEYLTQPKEYPVHISLAIMANCKHFIIGNTSFGWWAQYLSKNKNKIVVAPSRWYGIDIPCDIYQEGWKLVEV